MLVVLDEQAKLRHMEIIETAAALLRGYKVRIWSIFQDLNQLKSIYGNSWETFIANAGVTQVMTVNDKFTADYFSDRVGKTTRMTASTSSSTSTGHGAGGASSGTSHSQSYSQAGDPFWSPQDFYHMNKAMSVLFVRGLKYPVPVERRPYYADAFLSQIQVPTNPYHNPHVLQEYREALQQMIYEINRLVLNRRVDLEMDRKRAEIKAEKSMLILPPNV